MTNIKKIIHVSKGGLFVLRGRNTPELFKSLESIVDINAFDSVGNSMLHAAVHQQNYGVAEKLIQLGADVNLHSAIRGDTPLTLSVRSPLSFMELLINNGANVDLSNNDNTLNPISFSARLGKNDHLRLLFEHRANPNIRLTANETALIHAAFSGQMESVKLLLEYGADYKATNRKNQSAAYVGLTQGFTDIYNHINAFAKERASEKEHTSLLSAVTQGDMPASSKSDSNIKRKRI